MPQIRILKTGETGEYSGETVGLLRDPPIFTYKIILNNEIRWLRAEEFRFIDDIRKIGK